MRILHLVHTPRHSGAESLVRDLCKLHAREGVESAIASLEPSDEAFLSELMELGSCGIKLFVPSYPSSRVQRLRNYAMCFRAFKPDIIFAHSVLPSFYGRLALPFRRGAYFVTVLHSATNDDYENPYLRGIERILSRFNACVVAVSDQGAASYRRRFRNTAPVYVVKNGVDIAKFKRVDRAMAREMLKVDSNQRIVVQVGRLSPVKYQDFTVKALAPLIQRNVDLKIWLAGLTEDIDYEKGLRLFVSEQGLEDGVEFLGSRKDVAMLLAAADLFVMPSQQEAHSVGILEALASGIPILASDIEAFQFAGHYAGVKLMPISDAGRFGTGASGLLSGARHHDRDLAIFDIENTAKAYLLLADRLMANCSPIRSEVQ